MMLVHVWVHVWMHVWTECLCLTFPNREDPRIPFEHLKSSLGSSLTIHSTDCFIALVTHEPIRLPNICHIAEAGRVPVLRSDRGEGRGVKTLCIFSLVLV